MGMIGLPWFTGEQPTTTAPNVGDPLDLRNLIPAIQAAQGGAQQQPGLPPPPTVGGYPQINVGVPNIQDYLGLLPTSLPTPGLSKEFQRMLQTGQQLNLQPLEDRLRIALAELVSREAAQQQVLGQMPGQVQGITQTGMDQLLGLGGILGQQAGGAGPVPLSDIGLTGYEGIAPALGSMAAIQQSRLADVPVLGLAGSQYIGGLRTATEISHQEALAELAKQQQQDLMQLAIAQMGEEGATQRALLGARTDILGRHLGISGDVGLGQAQIEAGLAGQQFGAQTDMDKLFYQAQIEQALQGSGQWQAIRQANPVAASEALNIAGLFADDTPGFAKAIQDWVNRGPANERGIRQGIADQLLMMTMGAA